MRKINGSELVRLEGVVTKDSAAGRVVRGFNRELSTAKYPRSREDVVRLADV